MNIKITNLRGTVFTQRIPLDNNSLTKLLPLFPNFSVEMVPTAQEAAFPIPMAFNWSLVNEKKDCRVIFSNNTIDIVREIYIDYTEDAIKEFAELCQKSYKAIFAEYKNVVSRMALAPTLKVELSGREEFVELSNKIASIKSFKETPISTMSFTDVYRVNEEICGNSVMINYLSNFNSSETIEGGTVAPVKEVVFAADINTFQLAHNEFNDSHLVDFYQKVADWYLDFYRFYFE